MATTRSRWLLLSPSRSRPPRPPLPPSRRPRLSRSPRESRLSRLSWAPWLPADCSAIMRSFQSSSRSQSSELQSVLACGIGQRRAPSAVGVATAVEDHAVDAGGLGALGDQLAYPHAAGFLVTIQTADVALDRRRGGQRGSGLVVDQLHVNVPRGPVDHQPRTLRSA